MDNFEDKRVENDQSGVIESPLWIQKWAQMIIQPPFLSQEMDENERKTLQDSIERIFLDIADGHSCTVLEPNERTLLAPLCADAVQLRQQMHDHPHSVALSGSAPFIVDQAGVYLYRYWQYEQRLSQQIQRLQQQVVSKADTASFAHLFENPEQRAALNMVGQSAFNLITGGPGTGKTYTLARIIAVLRQSQSDLRIALAAPTGKAAQRMQEALQHAFSDPILNEMGLIDTQLKQQTTQTIHRLLGIGQTQTPKFNTKHPLPYDVIVIDEASMLDISLATWLFEAIPENCRLILLGDAQQLPAVGVGAVLADLQAMPTMATHHVHLRQSHRFNDQAQIGRLAGFIQNAAQDLAVHMTPDNQQAQLCQAFHEQIQPEMPWQAVDISTWPSDQIDLVRVQYLPESYVLAELLDHYAQLFAGFAPYLTALKRYLADSSEQHQAEVVDAFQQYRILCAMRHGDFGLHRINQHITYTLTKALNIVARGEWFVGRPVMMDYNDYQLGLSNGDIGICFYGRQQKEQFEVYFPSLNKWVIAARLPSSIETAFCLTIHKSQGSEFTHVAVVLDQAASRLLSQELLYTAITRAKKVVSLMLHRQAFVQSLVVKTQRHGGLITHMFD